MLFSRSLKSPTLVTVHLEVMSMSYLIALGIGAICMGLVSVLLWARPVETPKAQGSDAPPSPSLIADAPPPENQGTPGSRT